MRKWFVLASACLSLCCSSAVAEIPRKDASYFCVAEAAGGLAFNPGLKKWAGTIFKADDKFVLRLKFVNVQQGEDFWDKDETYSNFDAYLTPSGTNSEVRCTQPGSANKTSVSIGKYSSFRCYAGLQDYHFNLENNRYMNLYPVGYVDGANTNENTPSVTGGVCTKIN
jgi:hypothetical protein